MQGYFFREYVEILHNKGITTANGLNVRSSPSINAQCIDYLYKGTQIFTLKEIKTDDPVNPIWLKIFYLNGKIGYVSKQYVKLQTNSDGTYFKTYVTAVPLLNFRSEPSTESDVIEVLREGSHLIFLKTQFNNDRLYKKWYQVNYNGKIG